MKLAELEAALAAAWDVGEAEAKKLRAEGRDEQAVALARQAAVFGTFTATALTKGWVTQ